LEQDACPQPAVETYGWSAAGRRIRSAYDQFLGRSASTLGSDPRRSGNACPAGLGAW